MNVSTDDTDESSDREATPKRSSRRKKRSINVLTSKNCSEVDNNIILKRSNETPTVDSVKRMIAKLDNPVDKPVSKPIGKRTNERLEKLDNLVDKPIGKPIEKRTSEQLEKQSKMKISECDSNQKDQLTDTPELAELRENNQSNSNVQFNKSLNTSDENAISKIQSPISPDMLSGTNSVMVNAQAALRLYNDLRTETNNLKTKLQNMEIEYERRLTELESKLVDREATEFKAKGALVELYPGSKNDGFEIDSEILRRAVTKKRGSDGLKAYYQKVFPCLVKVGDIYR